MSTGVCLICGAPVRGAWSSYCRFCRGKLREWQIAARERGKRCPDPLRIIEHIAILRRWHADHGWDARTCHRMLRRLRGIHAELGDVETVMAVMFAARPKPGPKRPVIVLDKRR